MTLLRTPDECFANIQDYPFEPNYVEIPAGFTDGSIRSSNYRQLLGTNFVFSKFYSQKVSQKKFAMFFFLIEEKIFYKQLKTKV